MTRGLLVLGTDTGVGKTFVACALLIGLRARGHAVAAIKPMETGFDPADRLSDAKLLAAAAGEEFDTEVHVPSHWSLPLAPRAAAAREGATIDVAEVLKRTQARLQPGRLLLAELAGGLRVPLSPGLTNVEFAQALGWPAILVARAGLGTLNHTVLSCEVAAASGLSILGFVLNGERDLSSSGVLSNRKLLEEMTQLPCLGELPPVFTDPGASFALDAARRASQDLDWPELLRLLIPNTEAEAS